MTPFRVCIETSLQTFQYAIEASQACVDDINSWMSSVKLKLNTDKTELLIISTPHSKQFVQDVAV